MGENDEKIWKKFLKKHWKMFVLFILVAIVAFIGAVYIFLWFVGDAQLTGLVPGTLGLWTMGHFVAFLLHLIAREILFIGIPIIIVVAAIYFLWWKKLPDQERNEYRRGHLFGKRSRRTDGEGAITFLINVFFILKVYIDGNWDKPFADWTFDYLVYSCLTAFIWVAIVFGIPILIGGSFYIHSLIKNKS